MTQAMTIKLRRYDIPPELLVFAALVAVLNMHLLTGGSWATDTQFIFSPQDVMRGELWRILTYPFVHVSLYHLVLDAGAFFMLYRTLSRFTLWKRLGTVALCSLSSLGVTVLTTPEITQYGLSGLSGTAHGLMAFGALSMMYQAGAEREERVAGGVMLAVVVIKSMHELITGRMLFTFLHFGMYGIPLAACHGGGVLGGLLAYAMVMRSPKQRHDEGVPSCALSTRTSAP